MVNCHGFSRVCISLALRSERLECEIALSTSPAPYDVLKKGFQMRGLTKTLFGECPGVRRV